MGFVLHQSNMIFVKGGFGANSKQTTDGSIEEW